MTNAYSLFETRIIARRWVSESMLRITLEGAQLGSVGRAGLDQRVKLLPQPSATATAALMVDPLEWYAAWLELPDADRPLMRTYTFSGIRPDERQVDIDFAMAGGHAHGPGAEYALHAELGTPALLAGPLHGAEGNETVGVGWLPVKDVLQQVLIVGDETALPAIRAIVASLAAHVKGLVVLEVPAAGDVIELERPTGVEVRWCVRARGESGLHELPFSVDVTGIIEEPEETLWSEAAPGEWYGWVAGETHWVARIRKGARQAGISKDRIAFMGYWREGVAKP